jgi:hypothetical protein
MMRLVARTENIARVTAIYTGGDRTELSPEGVKSYYDDYVPRGMQLAGLTCNAVILVFEYEQQGQNGVEECEEYMVLSPPQWAKLRERIEGRMGKTSDKRDLAELAKIAKLVQFTAGSIDNED